MIADLVGNPDGLLTPPRDDEARFCCASLMPVHEVVQVVAAGHAIGDEAADAAVIAKIVRVMRLAALLIALSAWLARSRDVSDAALRGAVRNQPAGAQPHRHPLVRP